MYFGLPRFGGTCRGKPSENICLIIFTLDLPSERIYNVPVDIFSNPIRLNLNPGDRHTK